VFNIICYTTAMNQWSRNRKRIIFFIIVLALIILVGAPLFFLFYRAPACIDKKQNGDETGVDCGGSCQLLCTAESLPLILKGDPRVLEIKDNTFEIVALMENSNTSGEIYRAKYTFKLYGATSTIPIKIVEGETYVPRGTTFALFEGPLTFEEGVVPTRAVLEWKEESLVWQKNLKETPEFVVKGAQLSREDTSPRLDATIENVSLESISNIDIVALISDETGSIFAASKTFIDILPVGGSAPVVFTWPKVFSHQVLNTEIIVRIFPDRSFIR